MVAEKKETKIEEYKYVALVGSGSLLILLVLIFVIGNPLWKDLQKTSRELKEKRAVLTKLEEKLENLKGLKEKEAEIKEKSQKVLAALPSDTDVSRLFVQFENIASANGLSIMSVSGASTAGTTTNTLTGGTMKSVSYTVNGSAKNYQSFKSALLSLEDALRILSVSKVDASNNSGEITVNLTVSTYVRSGE